MAKKLADGLEIRVTLQPDRSRIVSQGVNGRTVDPCTLSGLTERSQ